MNEINRRLDALNETQAKLRCPPIESVAAFDDPARIAHLEDLLKHIRVSLALGETNAVVVYCLAAQVVAWCIALEERDEMRVP